MAFEHYNEWHTHRALGYRSPQEYLRRLSYNGLSNERCMEIQGQSNGTDPQMIDKFVHRQQRGSMKNKEYLNLNIDTSCGTGFFHPHRRQFRQLGFELLPDPGGEHLAGVVFQS